MIKVGLTGGIGSGKTTVAKLFAMFGIPVYYADERAKSLMHTDPVLRCSIQEIFGKQIYIKGLLDKQALAAIVFKDTNALKILNSLVHPRVREDFHSWVARQQSPYVVEEAAVLLETGMYKEFDFVVSVLCPMSERITRLLRRDNTTLSQIQERIAAQTTDAIRQEKSDYLLQNSKDNLLLPQIIGLDKALRGNNNI